MVEAKPTRKVTKKKVALILFIVLVITFLAVFNTSTRYGRWLFWQDADMGDINRFAFKTVEHEKTAVRAFLQLPVAAPVQKAIDDFRVEDESLEEFMASHQSTAFIIVHDNRLVLERYYQGLDRTSLHSSMSCTKSIVSLLVGEAIEDGLIKSVDDPISNYVDGLHSDFDTVTIRQLLTMTSGISDSKEKLFDAIPAPWSDEVCAYYDPNIRKLAKSFRRTYPPGERFEYHDFSPILIGMMLENATGKSMSDYLSERIWQPAAMQFPARWSVDSSRHDFEKPEAGFHARAIDYARLGMLLLDPNQNLVSKSWLAESVLDRKAKQLFRKKSSTYSQRARDKGQVELADHIDSLRYGYYWWGIERDGRYDYYANGRFGQFIFISPQAKLVIVRNGTGHGGLNDWHFGKYFFQLASDVIAASESK